MTDELCPICYAKICSGHDEDKTEAWEGIELKIAHIIAGTDCEAFGGYTSKDLGKAKDINDLIKNPPPKRTCEG